MLHKAEKVYMRMHEFFKGSDAKNNFVKEDMESQEYKDGMETLGGLKKVNLTNLAVINLKKKDNQKAIEFCNECLELEPEHIKAQFLKGRALVDMTEFKKAIEVFQHLLETEPEHAEAQRELQKANQLLKQYENKSAQMAKKMFA